MVVAWSQFHYCCCSETTACSDLVLRTGNVVLYSLVAAVEDSSSLRETLFSSLPLAVDNVVAAAVAKQHLCWLCCSRW